jgi:biopolymer transport protein ExbD
MKKKNNGIIIRLIDVVLIILFGFISISQIQETSKVKLPVSSETKLSNPDYENIIPVTIYPHAKNQWGFWIESENKFFSHIGHLHRYLIDKRRYYKKDIRLKIYSEARAPIKYAMQVADLCEQLKFQKSIIVKLKERQSGLR